MFSQLSSRNTKRKTKTKNSLQNPAGSVSPASALRNWVSTASQKLAYYNLINHKTIQNNEISIY